MTTSNHDFYTSCDSGDCGGTCWYCTLSICKVCGLYEGSLTTHCPGERVHVAVGDRVYNGKYDFKDGQWVEAYSPMMKSVIKGKIFDMFRSRSEETYATIRMRYGLTKEEYTELTSECLRYLVEKS